MEMGRRPREYAESKVSRRLIVGPTELAARLRRAGLAREAAPFLESGEILQIMADWTPSLGSEAALLAGDPLAVCRL
ncbi:hypothetical protein [Rhizobium mongolense]|uniref:hypothetical protein n=1 Tax=Rhizobium mongolense TaxID=57676 RepID=UPI001ABF1052|nr:hypothetical protein [Rhizobium mongolense]